MSFFVYYLEESNELTKMEDGQKYSLFKRPSDTSQLVQTAKEDIMHHLDVKTLAEELNVVGKFIHLAFNGLVAFPKLQGEVKLMEIRVMKLADESAVTLITFARASDQVLDVLETTYWYLYHSKEEMARSIFASIADVANRMENKAEGLLKKYKDEVTNVENILQKTYNAKGDEEEKKYNLTQTKSEIDGKLKRLDVTKREALNSFKKVESLFYDARRKEHKAIKNQANSWKKLANAFTSTFFKTEVYDMGAYKTAADAYKHEKEKYFEEMAKIQAVKDKALEDIAEYAHRVQHIKSEVELADSTIEALQKTLEALHLVVLVMEDAVLFWHSMSEHLYELKRANTNLEIEFKGLMETMNETERQKRWQSSEFKEKAIKNYVHWVAVKSVCYGFAKGLNSAQNELRKIVRESPRSKQEAFENVHKLAQYLDSGIPRLNQHTHTEF